MVDKINYYGDDKPLTKEELEMVLLLVEELKEEGEQIDYNEGKVEWKILDREAEEWKKEEEKRQKEEKFWLDLVESTISQKEKEYLEQEKKILNMKRKREKDKKITDYFKPKN